MEWKGIKYMPVHPYNVKIYEGVDGCGDSYSICEFEFEDIYTDRRYKYRITWDVHDNTKSQHYRCYFMEGPNGTFDDWHMNLGHGILSQQYAYNLCMYDFLERSKR